MLQQKIIKTMQKINRKEYSLTSSVFKLWYVLFTKLKYYYHRLLRRTLQGSVRGLIPLSLLPSLRAKRSKRRDGAALQSQTSYLPHWLYNSILHFRNVLSYQLLRKARAVFGSSPSLRLRASEAGSKERLGEALPHQPRFSSQHFRRR